MSRIIVWDSEEKAKQALSRRLRGAIKRHEEEDQRWEVNERTVFNTGGPFSQQDVRYSFESLSEFSDQGDEFSRMGINYTFKNLRFIHAQLSANPPTVVVRPASSDNDDRRRADAADRLVRHALRSYRMQEHVDRCSLNTLLYGTGFMKIVWDSMGGDIADYERGEDGGVQSVIMEGDIGITVPHPKNILVDPSATCWDDVRYVFERLSMPYEEALYRWPEQVDLLRLAIKAQAKRENREIRSDNYEDESVELYEYYEKGMPLNAMLGRWAICLEDGSPLEVRDSNPHSFGVPGSSAPPTAQLPYLVFTDIDVPDQVYGKSFVEYDAAIQDILNRLDSTVLDNVQANGVTRLVLPEGAEIEDDALTNSPWDVIKMTGTQPPHFVSAPSMMPDMYQLRDRIKEGIDSLAGVNESMFGQMSRETPNAALQYATNQGNMIRRRMFNKYVLMVEGCYRSYLNLVRKHWDESRTISVLGSEKAFETVDIKGADIESGFDLVVEYGASLSLDPMTRREEINLLMPTFEKAGVDPKTILKMLKLNELEGMYDILQLAEDRQREVFERMIASGMYIRPKDLQEHQGMLEYAYRYLMTSEYRDLEEDEQALIEQHIREREQLMAAGAAPAQGAGMPAPPGPAPAMGGGGPLPAPAGPTAAGPQLPGGGQG